MNAMNEPKSNVSMVTIVINKRLYARFPRTPFGTEQIRLSVCRAVIDSPEFTRNG